MPTAAPKSMVHRSFARDWLMLGMALLILAGTIVFSVFATPENIGAPMLERLAIHSVVFGLLALFSVAALAAYHRKQRDQESLVALHAEDQQRAEEMLRQSYALLEATGRIACVGGWSLDAATRTLTWSDEVFRIHALPPGAAIDLDTSIHYYAPEFQAVVAAAVENAIDRGMPFDLELQLLPGAGKRLWVRAQGECERNAAGKVTRVYGAFQDIDKTKRDELRIQRLGQIQIALSQFNAAIAHCTREDELFLLVCRNAVDLGGMKMAWIGLVDWSSQQVTPVAIFGAGTYCLKDIQTSVNPASEFGQGPTGNAIREDRPFWCQDFLNDPTTRPWHQPATACGWASVAALPVHRNGQIIGALTLCSDETAAFGEDERRLFVEMALNIDFALNSLVREAAHRQAEKAARDTLEIMKHFLDHLPGLAYVKDHESRVLIANQGFATLLGIAPEDMIGRTSREIFPGEFGEKITADDLVVLASGKSATIEEEFLGGYYESNKFVLGSNNGQAMLGGITLDVTERHRYQERQEMLLEINEIAGRLPEKAFLDYGLELAERLTGSRIGFLHFVNDDQETLELVTWTAGALKGSTSAYDTHYPISAAGIWADCIRRMRPVTFNDYANYRERKGLPEGHAALQRLISVPVIEEGQVRLILGVGNKAGNYDDFDVATCELIGGNLWRVVRRMRVEERLTQQLADLKVLNQKLEEAQNQLLQSEKMASIGQLAAGVAHELNNPIGFVQSNLGTLDTYLRDIFEIAAACEAAAAAASAANPASLDRVNALKAEKDFDFIRQDTFQLMAESKDGLARLAKIVRDLKDFSHAGEATSGWADLHQGLDATLNIVRNELKYKCTVSKEYGQLPPVWCVLSQLNQVFMNLLVNAAHAIPEKGEITIRSGRQGEEVFVAIVDSGVGIAPENLKRIFDPFFTTKPVGKGTGLGLSLAYSIVQKHRGRIEVHSLVGKGSTFTVWLPINPAPADGDIGVNSIRSS